MFGLKINISKMEIFPRRLENSMVTQLIQNFPRKISKFPGKYLVPPFTLENYTRLRCNRWQTKLVTDCLDGKARFSPHQAKKHLWKQSFRPNPIPPHRFSSIEVARQKDWSILEEFPMERRNTKQGLWGSLPNQLANNLPPKRERRPRHHWSWTICPGITSKMAMVPMETEQ